MPATANIVFGLLVIGMLLEATLIFLTDVGSTVAINVAGLIIQLVIFIGLTFQYRPAWFMARLLSLASIFLLGFALAEAIQSVAKNPPFCITIVVLLANNLLLFFLLGGPEARRYFRRKGKPPQD